MHADTALAVKLMHDIIAHTKPQCDDPHAEGYKLFYINGEHIGFNVSARVENLGQSVTIRTWSTYNV